MKPGGIFELSSSEQEKKYELFSVSVRYLKAQSCGLRENIEGLSDNGMKCDILLSYFS